MFSESKKKITAPKMAVPKSEKTKSFLIDTPLEEAAKAALF